VYRCISIKENSKKLLKGNKKKRRKLLT